MPTMRGMEHIDQLKWVSAAAKLLRVPSAWLKAEVESGQLPGFRAGRFWMVNVDCIGAILAKRAKGASHAE